MGGVALAFLLMFIAFVWAFLLTEWMVERWQQPMRPRGPSA
jgi:hypothetical protein